MGIVDPDVLRDRRFWYGHVSSQQVAGEEFDDQALSRAFGVSADEAFEWWERFTRASSLRDDDDGYVDDAPLIKVDLRDGVSIEIEHHPGAAVYGIGIGDDVELLAEASGHFRLPALRVEELISIAAAADRGPARLGSQAFALLRPVVWPEDTRDAEVLAGAFADALIELGLCQHEGAMAIAEAMSAADAPLSGYRWVEEGEGPVHSGDWSTRGRSAERSSIRRINGFIRRGVDGEAA